jgi:hypothetical protein
MSNYIQPPIAGFCRLSFRFGAKVGICERPVSAHCCRSSRRGQRLLCSGWGPSFCQTRCPKAAPQRLKLGTGHGQVRRGHLGRVTSIKSRMQGVQKIWRSKVL